MKFTYKKIRIAFHIYYIVWSILFEIEATGLIYRLSRLRMYWPLYEHQKIFFGKFTLKLLNLRFRKRTMKIERIYTFELNIGSDGHAQLQTKNKSIIEIELRWSTILKVDFVLCNEWSVAFYDQAAAPCCSLQLRLGSFFEPKISSKETKCHCSKRNMVLSLRWCLFNCKKQNAIPISLVFLLHLQMKSSRLCLK